MNARQRRRARKGIDSFFVKQLIPWLEELDKAVADCDDVVKFKAEMRKAIVDAKQAMIEERDLCKHKVYHELAE